MLSNIIKDVVSSVASQVSKLGNNSISSKAKNLLSTSTKNASIFGLVEDRIAFYPIIASKSLGNSAIDLADLVEARMAANIQIALSGNTSVIDLDQEDSIISFFQNRVSDNIQNSAINNGLADWKAHSESYEIFQTVKSAFKYLKEDSAPLQSYQKANSDKSEYKGLNKQPLFSLNETTYNPTDPIESIAIDEDEIGDEILNSSTFQTLANSASVRTNLDAANKTRLHSVPLIVEVDLTLRANDQIVQTQVKVGVKSVLHLVKSEDFVKAIASNSVKDSFILRFVKWNTGEIRFWKDLVFDMDILKKIFQRKKQKEAFLVLNAIRSSMLQMQMMRSFILSNVAIENPIDIQATSKILPTILPTASVAISVEEVAEIKSLTGLDLSKPFDSKGIFNQLNILSLYIVDELNDRILILDRVSNYKQQYSDTKYQIASSFMSISGLKKKERDKNSLVKFLLKDSF